MKASVFVCAAIMLLHGCASEWHADRPAKPISYELPSYRAERSVGNLRRLAVLPAEMRPVRHFGLPVPKADKASRPSGQWLTAGAASYLAGDKGYETVLVADAQGAWRPEVLIRPEFGSAQELAAAWEAARTELEVQAVVRRIGQALAADGVVVLWTLYSTVEKGDSVENISWVLLDLFLANIPLAYAMSQAYAGAVIYETASGLPIWRIELSGMQSPILWGTDVSATQLFENLENAIPRQVIK